ncbi:MAG: glycosyl hydrolase [Cyclobacteriaceae bacterium]
MMKITKLCAFLMCVLITLPGIAQRNKKSSAPEGKTYDEKMFNAQEWRNIGPFRGGRSLTSSGVISDPLTYYMGTAGGGVWKTEDAGLTWKNISDDHFNATSIGAVSVAESDPNVLYVGTGEACIRGVMTSHGDGVYKSTDGGKTWAHVGLDKTSQISEIRIHPNNPDVAYVAAQGNPYGPSQDRGIYRTMDGGKNWDRVHFVNESAGVNNLSMDMNNPRILYAAYWDHDRDPWFVRSGGEGSGIWKSTDGGDTWNKIVSGLPELMGKIGVSVSRANSDVVYAIVEAEGKDGGLYRSDDGGANWKQQTNSRLLHTRSWYYMHVFADPNNENLVYVLNAPFMKSIDGGKTFTNVQVPHGDNHDLWINPMNSQNMVSSDDGGATITFNGGKSWTPLENQPTAQFYRVNADNRFPYWVYGGQQDNTTVAIPSRTDGFAITPYDWTRGVGGGEAAHIAFDPNNPKYLYSSNITGMMDEYNQETGKTKAIKPWPIDDLGEPTDEMRYRYNWNPPVIVSSHNPSVIYYGSNVLHKSTNRGVVWDDISEDLTRNDPEKLGKTGGPITNEGAGGETYHTLMSLAESPHDANVIYTGADDGLVHVTKDGGANWQNVSPGPEGIINSIEVSPHDPGTVYITIMRYKLSDFKPYIYKSTNYGTGWVQIERDIPVGAYARVVREDPSRKDLLYAGTERGLYISFDGGAKWTKWQANLPIVPITDLMVHQNDLIVATHGRAYWIMDDIKPLHQVTDAVANSKAYLYEPKDVVKTNGFNFFFPMPGVGKNPYTGASIKYYMGEIPENDSIPVKLEIMDNSGNVIRTMSSDAKNKSNMIGKKEGMNVAKWDLKVEDLEPAKGVYVMSFTGTAMKGYTVGPGTYTAKLTYGDLEQTQSFAVVQDPRDEASAQDVAAQQDMVKKIYDDIANLYDGVSQMQQVRDQVAEWMDRMEDDEDIKEQGTQLKEKIDEVEGTLISPKQTTFQDVINFRSQLDHQLHNLMNTIDGNTPPVTKGEKDLYQELNKMWMERKGPMEKVLNEDVPAFNELLKSKGAEYIAPKEKKEEEVGS